MSVASPYYETVKTPTPPRLRGERKRNVTARFWPHEIGPSELLINQIMKTIRLNRSEATAMATRMLIAQFIMALNMPEPLFGETQGAA